MKKIIPIVLAILAIVLVVTFVFNPLSKIKDLKNKPTSNEESVMMKNSDETSFSGNLLDLFSLGKDLTCTFEANTEGGNIKGTVYVSGNKVRSDYMVEMPQMPESNIEGSTISDGDYVYTWTSMQEKGVKVAVPEETDEVTSDEPFSFESSEMDANLNQEFDYSCKPWVLNSNVFELPADKEFIDLNSSLMELSEESVIEGMNPEDLSSICSACDSAPTEDAALQCKQALGC